jgi:hypothetical protein
MRAKSMHQTITGFLSMTRPARSMRPRRVRRFLVASTTPGAGTPTGSVQFAIDGSNYGDPVALSGGTASIYVFSSGPLSYGFAKGKLANMEIFVQN